MQKAVLNQSKARKTVRKHLNTLPALPVDDKEENWKNVENEAGRTRAIGKIAGHIIAANALVIRSRVAADNLLIGSKILPEILEE